MLQKNVQKAAIYTSKLRKMEKTPNNVTYWETKLIDVGEKLSQFSYQ